MVQDVVDLVQQVTRRRLFADGPVHLGQLQSYPHREIGIANVNDGTGSHRQRRAALRLVELASVHGEPGGAGEGEHAVG